MAKTKLSKEEIFDEKSPVVEPVQPVLETQQTPEEKTVEEPQELVDPEPKTPNKFKKLWHLFRTKKKISIPVSIVFVLVILFAIPITRYGLLGLVVKKNVILYTVDDKSKSSVYGTIVSIDGKQPGCEAHSSPYPNCIANISVGTHIVKVSAANYQDVETKITVGLGKAEDKNIEIPMTATGRTVSVRISNKIDGSVLGDAHVKIAESESDTNKNGDSSVVVDPSAQSVEVEIAKSGYNTLKATLDISATGNNFNELSLTPAGKFYFLSKLSGKIDVVKTDLDGTNRQIILAGTGNEEDSNTIMLASRDWKYLALLSRRDSSKPKLYLIDTSNDQVTEIDSGDATFSLVGWQDHTFVYTVDRENVLYWQSNKYALKTFNADNLQLLTIDETTAEGDGDNDYASEYISNVHLQKGNIIYSKHWAASYYSVYRLAGKRMKILSAKTYGDDKQLLKDFDAGDNGYITAVVAKSNNIYYSVTNTNTSFYEISDGNIVEANELTDDSFYKPYPTYLLSPSGQSTFWYEPRDGKNTLFTGTQTGGGGEEIASLSEYVPYGWFGDDYLLVSKSNSELYILPSNSAVDPEKITKITDFHKPDVSGLVHGGCYGGQ